MLREVNGFETSVYRVYISPAPLFSYTDSWNTLGTVLELGPQDLSSLS